MSLDIFTFVNYDRTARMGFEILDEVKGDLRSQPGSPVPKSGAHTTSRGTTNFSGRTSMEEGRTGRAGVTFTDSAFPGAAAPYDSWKEPRERLK